MQPKPPRDAHLAPVQVIAALRVRGTSRQRVAYNSIMPAPVSGDSQAAAHVIGAKAAALIFADAA